MSGNIKQLYVYLINNNWFYICSEKKKTFYEGINLFYYDYLNN